MAARTPEPNTATNSEPDGQVPSLLTRLTNFAARVFGAFQFEASSATRARILALTYAGFYTAYQMGREHGHREGHAQAVDDMTQRFVEGIFGYGCRRMCDALLGVGNPGLLDMETGTALAPVRTYPWDRLLSSSSDGPRYECGMERSLTLPEISYPWHRPV